MSITLDLLSWEYALTGYEEKIISYLTLNSHVTSRTCPNVLHSFTLKGDMVSHTYLSWKQKHYEGNLLCRFIVSQQTLLYTRSSEKPWEK